MFSQEEFKSFADLVGKFAPEVDMQDIMAMALAAETKTFPKGSVVHGRKARVNAVLYVKTGLLRVCGGCGEEEPGMMLFYVGPGMVSVLTAPGLAVSKALDYCVTAYEDTTCYAFPENEIRRIEDKSPAVRTLVDRILAGRLDHVMSILGSLTCNDLKTRIGQYLAYMADVTGSRTIRITQSQIAMDLNCRREVVSRLLAEMKAEGKVEIGRNMVKVLTDDIQTAPF